MNGNAVNYYVSNMIKRFIFEIKSFFAICKKKKRNKEMKENKSAFFLENVLKNCV